MRRYDVLTEGAALRVQMTLAEQMEEQEDVARTREEEALLRSEQEAISEAKRRAADELPPERLAQQQLAAVIVRE